MLNLFYQRRWLGDRFEPGCTTVRRPVDRVARIARRPRKRPDSRTGSGRKRPSVATSEISHRAAGTLRFVLQWLLQRHVLATVSLDARQSSIQRRSLEGNMLHGGYSIEFISTILMRTGLPRSERGICYKNHRGSEASAPKDAGGVRSRRGMPITCSRGMDP